MNELKCDLHAAISWVEELYRSTRNKFLVLWTKIPSWGPETDVIASQYLHGIANWVRGNDSWVSKADGTLDPMARPFNSIGW